MGDDAKPTIYEALSSVMADVHAVKKGDRNTQQNYSFRGIDAVVNAVGPVLRKHGVIAVPHATEAHYRDVQTSQGKPSRECTVRVTYRFYGPTGDYIDVEVPGESMDFGDKGAPKAMSVAYRIALLQALCIPTDEPEPDASSYERERTSEPQRVTDAMWLESVQSRITAASTVDELQQIENDAKRVYGEYRLTADDARRVRADVASRRSELVPA